MAPKRETYPAGHTVETRYEIVKYLGGGAMGSVYEAFDTKVERRLAIKFLGEHLVDDADALKRFEREAKAAGRIGHDNVCTVSDWGVADDDVPYLVMELLEGEALIDRLKRDRVLPFDEAMSIMFQILSALEAAHVADIVHRDLKPENIFLAQTTGDEQRVKLVDFGIAKFLNETGTGTAYGTVMGTLFYMSPEQASGEVDNIDHRTDLWAAGVILYTMLTGVLPFKRRTVPETLIAITRYTPPPPVEKNANVPETVSDVIVKALRKDMDERFDSAGDFAAALRLAWDATDPRAEAPVPPATLKSLDAAELLPTAIERSGVETAPSIKTDATVPPVSRAPTMRKPGPPRWVLYALGGGGLAAATLVAALTLHNAESDADSGRSSVVAVSAPAWAADAAPPEASPAEESAATADAARESGADGAVAPETVTLHLVGLPTKARVTFDDVTIIGNQLAAPAGHEGTLSVRAPGYQPLHVELTLAESRDLDLSTRLERIATRTKRPPRPQKTKVPAVVSDYGAE